jgi:hypothetical protein
MTNVEFRDELKTKLNHTQASRIISEHQGLHEAWARTRLSRSQYNQIRRLEERMANLYTSRPMSEPISMLDGGEIDIPFTLASRKEEYSPRAYEPLAEELIILFDAEEANVYINQLNYELKDAELRSATNAQEYAPNSDEAEDATRKAKNEADRRTKEFKAINDFMYGLSDVVGFGFEQLSNGMPITVDSLRADALQVFFNGSTQEAKNDLFLQVVDFVRYAVESENVKFNAIIALASGSEVANEILEHLLQDKEFAQFLMMLQIKQAAQH